MCPNIGSPHKLPLTWQLSAAHTQCHQQHGQERQQQGAQHGGDQDGRLHLQERAWTRPGCSPQAPQGQNWCRARSGPAGCRAQQVPGWSWVGGSCALLGGPGSPPLARLTGGQDWLWKTLDPRAVKPRPGLESGAPATLRGPCTPALPAPLFDTRLSSAPACSRKLW